MILGSIANHMYSGKAPDLLAMLTGKTTPEAVHRPVGELLNELYRETSETLLDSDDEIALLLLDEEASLAHRADSLADWCRGYLFGLLQGEHLSIDQLPEDGPEIARDILAISEATHSESENEQEEEWAFAELEEYVKVGVRLIFEFIIRFKSGQQNVSVDAPPTIQ